MTEHFIHFQFMLPPELRRPLAARAFQEKVPLDELVVRILEEAVQRRKTAAPSGDASAPRDTPDADLTTTGSG
jgi:hypothetical protein